jgi:hypothetical protein
VFGGNAGVKKEIDSIMNVNNMPPILKQYAMGANWLGNLLTPSEKTNSMRENLASAQQGNNETSIRDGLTPLKPLTPREDIPPLTQNIYFTGNPDREEVTAGVNDANDVQAQLRQTNDNLGDSG